MEARQIDADRRRALRRMKAVALGLLVAAAVVYALCRAAGGDGWVGYVEAFAEAAMVGALADWFAVTALFRHPLGLPIPHTAIIPERKDQIGRSLGEFVESNFLTHELLAERVRQADVATRVGTWLAEPANAARPSAMWSDVLRGALDVLDDGEVQAGLERMVRRRLDAVEVAPLAGRALELTVAGGHHQRLLDAVLSGARGFLDDNRETLRARLHDESPWWVPEPIDDRIFDKIFSGAGRFLDDVRADPDHPMRHTLDARLAALADRLHADPALAAKGDQLRHELLEQPDVRAWIESMWSGLKAAMIEVSDDPASELRVRITVSLQRFGGRLVTEPGLRAKLDEWIMRAIGYVVDNYRHQVGDLIATTVERWDGEATAEKIELQVGRDLQFIRLNGTIVGGLAGLAIHTISQLA